MKDEVINVLQNFDELMDDILYDELMEDLEKIEKKTNNIEAIKRVRKSLKIIKRDATTINKKLDSLIKQTTDMELMIKTKRKTKK